MKGARLSLMKVKKVKAISVFYFGVVNDARTSF